MAYKGIDVSAHNGTINWTKVKSAGIAFVMLRMGDGTTTDKKFIEYPFTQIKMKKGGIQYGFDY